MTDQLLSLVKYRSPLVHQQVALPQFHDLKGILRLLYQILLRAEAGVIAIVVELALGVAAVKSPHLNLVEYLLALAFQN